MTEMTSLQRVFVALQFQEPDRVPFLLPATMHGAKELGLTLREYFSKAEYVAEGQMRLQARYHADGLFGFFYGPLDSEAWGGETVFFEDGPPNSGLPYLKASQIQDLQPPRVRDCPGLQKALTLISLLKERSKGEAPVFGVAVSPFSLPVMQMGFDHYLDLMMEQPDLFERLMAVNTSFCIEWANAQLDAGATAVVYFDPLSSTTITPREVFQKTGLVTARRVLSRIHGGCGYHFASGRCLSLLDDIAQTGALAVGVSALEDLAELKLAAAGRLALIGNLNGIEMRRWTPIQAETAVKDCIARAGVGGGFILSDNHGEIPFQTPDEILAAISEAVHHWGQYPLKWVKDDGKTPLYSGM